MNSSQSVNAATAIGATTRFQLLDYLRGFAAIAVVLYHAVMQHGQSRALFEKDPFSASFVEWIIYVLGCGYLGVPIFFVISGYCISAAAINQREKGYSIWRYVSRRFRRIYPTYWICLAFFLMVCWIPGLQIDARQLTVSQWLGNFFLFEQWRPNVFGPDTPQYLNAVAWTLCYEEQFYFLVGLILVLCPRKLFAIFGLITLFVGFLEYGRFIGPFKGIANQVYQAIPAEGFVWDRYWLFFASGIGLFLYRNSRSVSKHLLPVVLFLLIAWEFWQMDWQTNRFQSRVAGFGMTLTLMFVADRFTFLDRGAAHHFARWLGERTYSIYLIHLPFVVGIRALEDLVFEPTMITSLLINVPVSLVVSIGLGHLFYMLVERHFLPNSKFVAQTQHPNPQPVSQC